MCFKYSQKLRTRLIDYFKSSRDITITEEQADEYLDSLARVFAHFSECDLREGVGNLPARPC